MKYSLETTLVVAAAVLAFLGTPVWSWFLVAAVVCVIWKAV